MAMLERWRCNGCGEFYDDDDDALACCHPGIDEVWQCSICDALHLNDQRCCDAPFSTPQKLPQFDFPTWQSIVNETVLRPLTIAQIQCLCSALNGSEADEYCPHCIRNFEMGLLAADPRKSRYLVPIPILRQAKERNLLHELHGEVDVESHLP